MILRSIRWLAYFALPAALPFAGPAFAASSIPLGIDLGGSGPVTAIPRSLSPATPPKPIAPHQGTQMAHEGHDDAHATGTVNSVDAAAHKVNITHQPIPAIGWPSMTMDFAVAPKVNLGAVKPGMKVNFTIERGTSGMYEVQAIMPAGGSP
jgi:Cu/Ag efflux protein CusF